MRRPGLTRGSGDVVIPSAQEALDVLLATGRTHRWVHSVRSSQALALNLFGPLTAQGRINLFESFGVTALAVDEPVFEFEDQLDRLEEESPRSRHRTQVDVFLKAHTDTGQRVGLFVEVKFTETDFGHCSAYESLNNDTRDNCRTPGLFGAEPQRCFQLRNHGLGGRRYANVLDLEQAKPPPEGTDDGGCWSRLGASQPMRNVALAQLMLDHGDLDQVFFALTAPQQHEGIWRRYAEFRDVFERVSDVALLLLSAEEVGWLHPDFGQQLWSRYNGALANEPGRQVLVHMNADSTLVWGVWLRDQNGRPVSYYPRQFAVQQESGTTAVLRHPWVDTWLDLPRASPYGRSWAAGRLLADTPKEAYRAVVEKFFT